MKNITWEQVKSWCVERAREIGCSDSIYEEHGMLLEVLRESLNHPDRLETVREEIYRAPERHREQLAQLAYQRGNAAILDGLLSRK